MNLTNENSNLSSENTDLRNNVKNYKIHLEQTVRCLYGMILRLTELREQKNLLINRIGTLEYNI